MATYTTTSSFLSRQVHTKHNTLMQLISDRACVENLPTQVLCLSSSNAKIVYAWSLWLDQQPGDRVIASSLQVHFPFRVSSHSRVNGTIPRAAFRTGNCIPVILRGITETNQSQRGRHSNPMFAYTQRVLVVPIST